MTSTRTQPNGWRPDPADVFELVGSYGRMSIEDYFSEKPVAGSIAFDPA